MVDFESNQGVILGILMAFIIAWIVITLMLVALGMDCNNHCRIPSVCGKGFFGVVKIEFQWLGRFIKQL